MTRGLLPYVNFKVVVLEFALDSLKDILLCNCCGSGGFPSKRLGLQFVMIHFVVLLRTSQALQFQTAFLLIHSIVHAIVDDTFSFLTDVSQMLGV